MSLLHLLERFANGVWRVVQEWPSGDPLLRLPRRRTCYWHEPAATFRDRLGQFCWRTPDGTTFCSDTAKPGLHGTVEGGEQAMRRLGFTKALGELIEENGVGSTGATPSKSQS